MDNISKKLKNVLTVKGKKEKLNEFIERLKKSCKVIEVELPKYDIRKIDSSFIDKKWNIANDIENVVFYAIKNNTLVISFSNENLENEVINIVEQLELDARYRYLIENIESGLIVRERFICGQSISELERESKLFSLSQYSVARCF